MKFDKAYWPTPNRKTHVLFDLNNSYVTEQAFAYGRTANLMFRDKGAGYNQLEFTSGWGIKAYHENQGLLVERDEAEGTILHPEDGSLIVPSGYFESVYTWAPPSNDEMPNATAGASSHLVSPGGRHVRKTIPAGTDLSDVNLIADQVAFPFTRPTDEYGVDPTILLDRIAVTRDNDSSELNIHLQIQIFGTAITPNSDLGYVLFTGPAGANADGIGTGLYGIVLNSSDRCTLYEKPVGDFDAVWLRRFEFACPTPLTGDSRVIRLNIYKSKSCAPPSEGAGGFIDFDFFMGATTSNTGIAGKIIDPLNVLVNRYIADQHKTRFRYKVPGDGTSRGSTNAPIRIGLRRDLLGQFQLAWFKYPTDLITADDAPFSMPSAPFAVEDEDLNPINWFLFSYTVCVSESTVCYATLHRADTGAELTNLGNDGNAIKYAVPAQVKTYFVRLHIQSDGAYTPQFFDWYVSRDAVRINTGLPSWQIGDATHPKSVLRGYNIKGPERDLGHASATLEIDDPLNVCTEFKIRAGFPMRIETEYSTDSSKRLVTFFGFMDRADGFRMPPAPDGRFPQKGWNKWHLTCKGAWQLLEENFIDAPFFTMLDQRTGLELEVASTIRDCISRAGWPKDGPNNCFDSSFDAIHTKIVASNLDYSQNIDMLEKISQVVKTLARDYLEQFLDLDANVTNSMGIWRLHDIPTAPYTNVASFTMDGPTGAGPKLTHYLPSYPTVTDAVSGLPIPQIPIQQGTVNTSVKYPEANWLLVTSFGNFGGTNSAECYMAFKFNPISFNYSGTTLADPTQPEYLGRRLPIYVVDPALGTANNRQAMQDAVNALATRIARLTFKAVKTMRFRAPIVPITNEKYTLGGTAFEKRTLRYYDPVLVDGEQWLIRNVNPDPQKDIVQYAFYELEAPREGEDI